MELIEASSSAVAEYQPFYAQLVELETNNSKLVFNYESAKGNKEARSHVHALRLTKGALERTRKEAKAESLKKGRAIDAEAAEIELRIEAMIVVHQQKLDEIEQREADRIADLKYRLAVIQRVLESRTASDLRAHISVLEATAIDDTWAEFVTDAAKLKDVSLVKHRELLTAAEQAEAAAAELARLRLEAEARAKADHEAAIAKAAEERAKAEAERKAQEVAAAQAKAIADAEAKAKAEREAGERRELELKLAAENAERRRVEAEQRAETERKEAAELADRKYKEATARAAREAEEAVQREKDRVAAVKAAEDAETAKREANKAHKAKVNRAALAAFVAGGMTEECAKLAVTLIASDKIPAVSIDY